MPTKNNLEEVEYELEQKVERLELALEATNLGIWDFNPITGDTVWDETCKKLLGFPPHVRSDYSIYLQTIVEEHKPIVEDQVERSIKYGDPLNIQYQIVRPNDNKKRWMKSVGRTFFYDNKKAIRMVGTIEDITDQIESKEKLEETQKALKRKSEILITINEVGKNISAELDHKKVVQLITDAGTEITRAQFGAYFYNDVDGNGEKYMLFTHAGLGKNKFKNFPMPRNTKIFSPTFNGERIVRYDDVTKQKEFGQNDPYFGMPKGHPPVKSYLAVPVVSKSGDVLGGLFFGHSKPGVFTKESEEIIAGISSQAAVTLENAGLYEQTKRAHEAYKEQTQLIYRIFEEAPAVIIITKGKDHVYDFVNKKAREIFGDALKIGETSNAVRGIPKYSRFFEIIDGVYETGKPAMVSEVPIDLKDFALSNESNVRYFNSFYFPVKDNNGVIEGIIRYGLDITEQVKARKSIEDFMSIASHELKTPITTLMSYLELLQDQFYNQAEDNKKFFIERLGKGVNRLNNLVSDLLNVTRISKGRLQFNFEDFEAEAFIKEALDNIKPVAGRRKITFSGGTDKFIHGDKSRLEQVITNLVENALKYSEDQVDTILEADDYNIYFSVKDYGIGMDEKVIGKLFSQFYVIDEKKSTGLGIGLFISKEIIKGHNGDILVKSKPGKGSVFTIVLPALPIQKSN